MARPLPHSRLSIVPLVLALPWLSGMTQATRPASAPATPPSAAFLKLVPDPSAVTKVGLGFRFLEGPTWLPDGRGLVYSDIPANTLYLHTPGATTQATVFVRPSGNANGTTLDREGRLVVCRHGDRDVIRYEKDGSTTTLATHFEGKRLNSPNDLIVAADGSVYFTDPPYGVRPPQRELDFCGVYRIAPDGKLSLVARDLAGPNGITLSPDGKTLYVTETGRQVTPKFINAYDVLPDGSLGPPRRFYTVERGSPDGIRTDPAGNLWATAGDGIHVVSPAGELIGRIATPEVPANLTFGGADGNTLYITARTGLYTIRVSIR